MAKPTMILGLESSCDDTAAAVVTSERKILSSVVMGQNALHEAFGGVVPEIAARAHVEKLDIAVEQSLSQANVALSEIDAIAVTAGPGLIGGVMAGVLLARGIAIARDLPLIGVNHLAGHALTPRLTDNLPYPYLMLLISGGHCQFLVVHGPDRFERLGGTIDDAPGEAFDKTARILGLAQPGGPSIEAEAASGNATRIPLPRPLLDRDDCNMSFSGLKTAVLRARDNLMTSDGSLHRQDRADICAAFQAAVSDVLAAKAEIALTRYLSDDIASPAFAVAGGVASNGTIRHALENLCATKDVAFCAPPLSLCTDNAAMIAWAGHELFVAGIETDPTPRPRWPLDDTAAPLLGSGRKGAKA